ncbi:uncharacterized protein I303_105230 [Kwoniella dejecticola CBS 10117]|uniref:Aminoglycoside phosphotransferase domain-containing protein n=1 Tax=Kwoniella dejecticola CBS 10117 TaxID=1296121 RepID=A0A1A6A337_9TREE|nr:uncharacterized protein I303_05323 [Kwoniella dejecticola CBS 10117]OBR84465.1 hypothetical protein I303_05323 [Kwoniella dejecticola CBS 10117]
MTHTSPLPQGTINDGDPTNKSTIQTLLLVNAQSSCHPTYCSFDPLTGRRTFIKRSSTPEEQSKLLNRAGTPSIRAERSFSSLLNEVNAILYLRTHTSIPVPNIVAVFEDRGCLYMVQEYVENAIPATDAPNHLHSHITQHLEGYMSQLHNIRDRKMHSFSSDLHFPARLSATRAHLSHLEFPDDAQFRYVLCHGDLGWQNVMVDPSSGDIRCIIDWEYSGFYPIELEGQFWRRYGTASPNSSERSDADDICRLLHHLSHHKSFPTDYTLETNINYATGPTNNKGKPYLLRKPSNLRHAVSLRLTRHVKRLLKSQGSITPPIPPPPPPPAPGIPASLPQFTQAEAPSVHDVMSQQSKNTSSPQKEDVNPVRPIPENSGVAKDVLDAPEWGDLVVTHPDKSPVTARTLAVQVAIASRQHLSKQMASLKRSFEIDYRATQDWTWAVCRDTPGYYYDPMKTKLLDQETLHLIELYRPLCESLSVWDHDMLSSTLPLERFQSQQTLALAYSDKINNRRKDERPTDDIGYPIPENLDPLVIRANEVYTHIPADRDQAFRESETAKWDAMKKFAETLLIVSHAAHSLLPFTPDRITNQPSRHRDPSRKVAEDRVRDLLLGGTGGWSARVLDVEDWIPLNPQEKGVPEEEDDETQPLPERVLRRYHLLDAEYLASLQSSSRNDERSGAKL